MFRRRRKRANGSGSIAGGRASSRFLAGFRSRDESSGAASKCFQGLSRAYLLGSPPSKLVMASGFGAPLTLGQVVPTTVGTNDVVGVFCRSAGADHVSEQALRALPPHLQQLVMAEGSVAGQNPSALLLQRIRKATAPSCEDGL